MFSIPLRKFLFTFNTKMQILFAHTNIMSKAHASSVFQIELTLL